MAAEEKTEKATPKRRQDERKKGNVFQSSDVAAVMSLLVLFNSLGALAPGIYRDLKSSVELFFSYAGDKQFYLTDANIQETMGRAMIYFARAAVPILLIGVLTAVIVTFFQTRMSFSWEVMKFKLDRISPIKGFKRMFSLRSLMELIKALVKISCLIWVIILFVRERMHEFARLMDGSVAGAVAYTGKTAISLVNTVGMVFLFVAAFDFLYQWWEYEKNLKMSKQEIKDEYKQIEGYPQMKTRIRERQRQIASRRMMQNVPNADVIIRNPTHFAVALGYDSGKHRAPVVLAKGADRVALKIVEIGEENGVYIMENPPLARGLFAAVEVDMEIPEEYYQTVAQILAFVYKLKDKKV